jgi:hypothetical protein
MLKRTMMVPELPWVCGIIDAGTGILSSVDTHSEQDLIVSDMEEID